MTLQRGASEAFAANNASKSIPEDAVTAALRELKEETVDGAHFVEIIAETPQWHYYDLRYAMVGTIWKCRCAGQRQKRFAMRFLGEDSDVAIYQKHRECKAWRWAQVDTPIDLAAPFKRDLDTDVIAVLAPQL